MGVKSGLSLRVVNGWNNLPGGRGEVIAETVDGLRVELYG